MSQDPEGLCDIPGSENGGEKSSMERYDVIAKVGIEHKGRSEIILCTCYQVEGDLIIF